MFPYKNLTFNMWLWINHSLNDTHLKLRFSLVQEMKYTFLQSKKERKSSGLSLFHYLQNGKVMMKSSCESALRLIGTTERYLKLLKRKMKSCKSKNSSDRITNSSRIAIKRMPQNSQWETFGLFRTPLFLSLLRKSRSSIRTWLKIQILI